MNGTAHNDDEEICEDCIKGHMPGCDALDPAHDVGDLISRSPCSGCCINGCKPTGLQAMQDESTISTQRFFKRFLVPED